MKIYIKEAGFMDRYNLFSATILVAALTIPTVANSALVGRLADSSGNYQAYYDTGADLTWLADANYAQTSGYDSDGRMSWSEANTWASNLTIEGVTGWRLPTTLQPDPSCSFQDGSVSFDWNCSGSEMGNMFHNVLGGTSTVSLADSHNANYNLFSYIQTDGFWYWSSTATPFVNNSWGFDFSFGGYQGYLPIVSESYAWAVYKGDVSVVPVPSAVWLFGSGLIGLLGFARNKKEKQSVFY